MMSVTPSELRANIYRLLDEVLETGIPLEVERNGRVLQITPKDKPSKLDRLVRRDDYIVGDSDDLIHMDWSHEWKPDV